MKSVRAFFNYYPVRVFLLLFGVGLLTLIGGEWIFHRVAESCRMAANMTQAQRYEAIAFWVWALVMLGGSLAPAIRRHLAKNNNPSELAADIVIASVVCFAMGRVYFDAVRYSVCGQAGLF